MKHDKIEMLDTILAHEEELIPSSGFLASVMERVREEAAAPPPIPFPWKRAIPGIALATGVLGWGLFESVRHAVRTPGSMTLPAIHIPAALAHPAEQAGWIALALGVWGASWLFSRRISGRSGLF